MKVRQGFVSNSSSSSFVIIGQAYDTSDFNELLEKALTEDQFKEYESDEYNFLDKTFPKLFPGIEIIEDGESEMVYLGEYPSIEKETYERIAQTMKKLDPRIKANDIELICEEICC